MIQSTLIMVGIALAMWIYAHSRDDDSARRGVSVGWQTLKRTLLLLLIAFKQIDRRGKADQGHKRE